jgi:hypothetical protein
MSYGRLYTAVGNSGMSINILRRRHPTEKFRFFCLRNCHVWSLIYSVLCCATHEETSVHVQTNCSAVATCSSPSATEMPLHVFFLVLYSLHILFDVVRQFKIAL